MPRRLSEQIELLRALWTNPSITFDGAFARVTAAGLAPLPVQRPIPIWIGASSEPAYRRIGRLGDGWFSMVPPGPHLDAATEVIRRAAGDAGRDPDAIGLEGRVQWDPADPDRFVRRVEKWRGAGASHLTIDTMYVGLEHVDDHIDALDRAASLLR